MKIDIVGFSLSTLFFVNPGETEDSVTDCDSTDVLSDAETLRRNILRGMDNEGSDFLSNTAVPDGPIGRIRETLVGEKYLSTVVTMDQ
jgi:hypothetical protein